MVIAESEKKEGRDVLESRVGGGKESPLLPGCLQKNDTRENFVRVKKKRTRVFDGGSSAASLEDENQAPPFLLQGESK